jgi:hypothetical protein
MLYVLLYLLSRLWYFVGDLMIKKESNNLFIPSQSKTIDYQEQCHKFSSNAELT